MSASFRHHPSLEGLGDLENICSSDVVRAAEALTRCERGSRFQAGEPPNLATAVGDRLRRVLIEEIQRADPSTSIGALDLGVNPLTQAGPRRDRVVLRDVQPLASDLDTSPLGVDLFHSAADDFDNLASAVRIASDLACSGIKSVCVCARADFGPPELGQYVRDWRIGIR